MTTIRHATLADAPGIARVHVESWRTTYAGIMPDEMLKSLSIESRTTRWQNVLINLLPRQCAFVAEDAGAIVGFAQGGAEQTGKHPDMAEVYAIYLLASHQRQGIGRALMFHATRHLASQGFADLLIWVAEENPSRAFYESLGGVQHGVKAEEFGGKTIREISYHWPDLPALAHTLQG